VFQFEHVDLDSGPGGKWDLRPLKLRDLKENLTKWQKALEHKGGNSLYMNNHDQPRMVSRFGNDGEYRVKSAKMLATMLHMMKGTPYIYQGEEIGMTNVRFDSIEEYEDIETLNMYREKREAGVPHEDIMKAIYVKGRDNARTPVQWNTTENGGFTTGTPWLKVNPNYKEINAEAAVADPDSVYHYYRRLIELRHNNEIVVYGGYDLIQPEDETFFAYERRYEGESLLVICNFTGENAIFHVPDEYENKEGQVFISNMVQEESQVFGNELRFTPYEARVYRVKH
jgi:oligo-1,6-glucosidase